MAINNEAFPDADKQRVLTSESFGNQLLDIYQACEECGLRAVDEYGMAVIGIRFEISHFFQFYLYHLIPRIEE